MTMETQAQAMSSRPRRELCNKGKLIGQKPSLRPKHVGSIRTRLQMDGRTRDLAMFNLAIDGKLRGCDIVALRVEDVARSGYWVDRATVRQKRTGRPVRFELTEQTRQALDDYIKAAGKKPGEFCSVAVAITTAARQPGNMPGSSRAGLQRSASTRTFSAHTLFDVPKRH
jgi:integrase